MDQDRLDLITIDDLCEALDIGRNAAYRLLNNGEIKGFRINRIWKIPKGALDDFIMEQSHLA